MTTYITSSPEETRALAKKLSQEIRGIIALGGELGAGKTTFTQGFAEGLGITDKIISPTFVLIRQHPIPNSKNVLPTCRRVLYHIDLYRLEEIKNIKDLGIDEMMQNPKNIILIEWAEKAKKLLPKNITWIKLEVIDKNTRRIKIRG